MNMSSDVISAAVCSGAGVETCRVTVDESGKFPYVRAELVIDKQTFAREIAAPDGDIASLGPIFRRWAERASGREAPDADEPMTFATFEELEEFLAQGAASGHDGR